MAYNNGFPLSYQPMYYQSPYQQNQPQPQNNGIIWVQGEAGAKSYLIAPNTTVQLWDSESQTIFLKSADASGMPSMKVLDYTIREVNQPTMAQNSTQNNDIYTTKEEFKAFQESLEKRLKALTGGKDESAL